MRGKSNAHHEWCSLFARFSFVDFKIKTYHSHHGFANGKLSIASCVLLAQTFLLYVKLS